MNLSLHLAEKSAPDAPAAGSGAPSARSELDLTVLMPCLNEAETVGVCVDKALAFLQRTGIAGEVVVADNGSTDGSQRLAEAAGARVVPVALRGYGDADDSYDSGRLEAFVDRLRAGDQLVMGNRFAGGIAPGAMPPLHRFLGNPVLSFVGRMLFRSGIGDFHCGLRGFDRRAIVGLGLVSPGMEFASEMVVKATLAGLRVGEVPTMLSRDGRSRAPHLRSWRDGWRHLRFLLMMSPRWLLLYPGLTLLAMGLLAQVAILRGPIVVRGVGFDIHTMLYAAGASILGLQLVVFSVVARSIGYVRGVLPMTPSLERFLRIFTLERGIVVGVGAVLAGFALAVHSVDLWFGARLAALDPAAMMRWAIPSVTLMIAGADIVFASFVVSFVEPLRLLSARGGER
jgi:hypothetical protein